MEVRNKGNNLTDLKDGKAFGYIILDPSLKPDIIMIPVVLNKNLRIQSNFK